MWNLPKLLLVFRRANVLYPKSWKIAETLELSEDSRVELEKRWKFNSEEKYLCKRTLVEVDFDTVKNGLQ